MQFNNFYSHLFSLIETEFVTFNRKYKTEAKASDKSSKTYRKFVKQSFKTNLFDSLAGRSEAGTHSYRRVLDN